MSEHILEKIQINGRDVYVEAAHRDSEGNIISETYATQESVNDLPHVFEQGDTRIDIGDYVLMTENVNDSSTIPGLLRRVSPSISQKKNIMANTMLGGSSLYFANMENEQIGGSNNLEENTALNGANLDNLEIMGGSSNTNI